MAIAQPFDECGFRQIVFLGDLQHQRIRQPIGHRYWQWHHGGGIAAEQFIGKSVDLEKIQFHCCTAPAVSNCARSA